MVKIPAELIDVLSRDSEVMGGDLCFTGTRIPVSVLLDNLSEGIALDEFLDNYPSLSLTQVKAVMEWENRNAHEALGLELVS